MDLFSESWQVFFWRNKMSYEGKNLETIALHAGWRADETTGSVAVPIHQTTSYLFESTEKAANLFALAELGNIYTRIMNLSLIHI